MNKFSVFAVVLVAGLLILNCNDDDNSNPLSPVSSSDLVGMWKCHEITESEAVDFIWVFNSNGNLKEYFNNLECTDSATVAKYTVTGNTISMVIDGESQNGTVQLQGNNLILTGKNDDGTTETLSFTKYTGALPPADWPASYCRYNY